MVFLRSTGNKRSILREEWKDFPGMEDFHFVPALSEPQPEDKWTGETGLITQVLERYLTTRIDRSKPMEGYLCGSPGMLDACISVMKKFEVPEDKI